MADDDRDRPSLELPSLSLGRKRRRKQTAAPPEPEPDPTPEPDPAPEPDAALVADGPPPAPPAESRPEPMPTPAPEEAAPSPPDPAPRPQPAASPLDRAPSVGEPSPERDVTNRSGASDQPDPETTGRRFTPPTVSGRVAAVVTGVLVGLIGVGLVWGATRLCELVRGTSSCGAPGALLLLAVVVVAVLLGKVLLDALGAPEPLSTSVLGVGVATVVTLLFLGGALLEWWMVLAVPVVTAASYALAHAVTTAVVGPLEDNMHR